MRNALERNGLVDEIARSRAPSEAQRKYLLDRMQTVAVYLSQASEHEILDEITALFAVMAHKPGEDIELSARIRLYVNDLKQFPAWAVADACAFYRTAIVGEGIYCPTPGQLCAKARGLTAAWTRELAALNVVLLARVVDDITPEVEKKRSDAVLRWENEIRPAILAAAAVDKALMMGKRDHAAALAEAAKPETPDEILARLAELPVPTLSAKALALYRGKSHGMAHPLAPGEDVSDLNGGRQC